MYLNKIQERMKDMDWNENKKQERTIEDEFATQLICILTSCKSEMIAISKQRKRYCIDFSHIPDERKTEILKDAIQVVFKL